MDRDRFGGGVIGLVVGDALGVPFEGRSRAELASAGATGMVGHGSHDQPPGTWSDDSSLTFCLMENLVSGRGLGDLGERFVRWLKEGYWTPFGRAFGIGDTCYRSISKLEQGIDPIEAGESVEYSNGNGSLMRILPVSLYLYRQGVDKLLTATHRISRLTHGHPRAQMACGFYSLLARFLYSGNEPMTAYEAARMEFRAYYGARAPYADELAHFERLLQGAIPELPAREIESSGYVIHTLEAAVWCLLQNDGYPATVLKAVNLGGDSDTTAAVAGGLAGLTYGYRAIPEEWLDKIARLSDIQELTDRFYAASGDRAVS